MLEDPALTEGVRGEYKAIIEDIIRKHEHVFDPEVLARLYEAVGDADRVRIERAKIAKKLA
jgi:hypothetical protein